MIGSGQNLGYESMYSLLLCMNYMLSVVVKFHGTLGLMNRQLHSCRCVGIPGAMQACAMCPILNLRYIPYYYCFREHFTSIPFYFVVYSIYTRACTVVTHPFASVTYRHNQNPILYLVLIRWTNYACCINFNKMFLTSLLIRHVGEIPAFK